MPKPLSPEYLRELRPTWRRHWLQALFEFANPSLQRRSWVEASVDHVSCYVECLSEYFSGLVTEDEYAMVLEQGLISSSEVAAVLDFHRLAISYRPPQGEIENAVAILEDPLWHEVVQRAQRTWHNLKELVSEEERGFMASLEAKWGQPSTPTN